MKGPLKGSDVAQGADNDRSFRQDLKDSIYNLLCHPILN